MDCCDYDCNQGRNCPVRQTKYEPESPMDQHDIEQAWLRLSMHNSELLLRVADLEAQLRRQSIISILKARIRAWRTP